MYLTRLEIAFVLVYLAVPVILCYVWYTESLPTDLSQPDFSDIHNFRDVATFAENMRLIDNNIEKAMKTVSGGVFDEKDASDSDDDGNSDDNTDFEGEKEGLNYKQLEQENTENNEKLEIDPTALEPTETVPATAVIPSRNFHVFVFLPTTTEGFWTILKNIQDAKYPEPHTHAVQIDVYVKPATSAEANDYINKFKGLTKFSRGAVNLHEYPENTDFDKLTLEVWNPEKSRALFLHENTKIDTRWYIFFKKMWQEFSERDDIMDISLMRNDEISKDEESSIFMGLVPSESAFSPSRQRWGEFLEWSETVDLDDGNFSVVGYDAPSKFHGWYMYFRDKFDLYTLYSNFDGRRALASNLNEYKKQVFEFPKNMNKHIISLNTLGVNLAEPMKHFGVDNKIDELYPFKNTVKQGKLMLESRKHKFVYLQLLNMHFLDMTKSWICKARTIPGVLEQTMFLVTDITSYRVLTEFGVKNIAYMSSGNRRAKLTYGHRDYFAYMLLRVHMIRTLLENKVSIFLIESDSTWYGNPKTDLESFNGLDIIAGQDDDLDQSKVEGGFIFLNATKNTELTWARLERNLNTYWMSGNQLNEMYTLNYRQVHFLSKLETV